MLFSPISELLQWTQDCPPQDCPPVGNPEVGNPDIHLPNNFEAYEVPVMYIV